MGEKEGLKTSIDCNRKIAMLIIHDAPSPDIEYEKNAACLTLDPVLNGFDTAGRIRLLVYHAAGSAGRAGQCRRSFCR